MKINSRSGRIYSSLAILIAFASTGTAAAMATTKPAPPVSAQPNGDVHACVKPSGAVDFLQFRTQNYGKCNPGEAAWIWARQDGVAAKPATLTSASVDIPANAAVPTGGSFFSQAPQLVKFTLHKGTYVVTVNVKATPNHAQAAQVFPQVFLYNQPKNAAFSGDVLNLGSVFEHGSYKNIDAYMSGSVQLQVTSDTTYYLYGFGYGDDTGASDYAVDSGSVQILSVSNS
jgi:hypothetical protein